MIARSASCCHRLAHRKMTLPLHGLFAMLLLAAGLGACSAAAQTATPNQASFDLGSVNVGSAGLPATVTFTFTAGGSIAAPEVLTQGAPNLDYTDAGAGTCTTNGTAHVYNAGDTCTVNVTFSPKSAGSRLGAVVLSDNSTPAIPVATAYLQGSGAGPQTAFIHNSVPNALPYFSNPPSFVPYGAAVDGADNLFFTGSSPLFELPAASGYAHLKTLQNVGPYTFGPALAVDGAGNIFTFAGGEIAEVLAVGGYTTVKAHASGFSFPHAIALDGAGNVFVTDENGIYEVPVETGYATVVTLPPVPDTDATGLAVDAAGNVFFTNCRYTIVCGGEVEELTAASNYTQTNVIATGPGFWDFLAVDGSGNVFATDIQLGTVTVISTAGGANIATLAYQFPGYSYLDGPRLLDIAVDSNNRNLFLIFNYAIDEMDLGDPPSLTFAPTAWNLLNEYAPHIIPEQTVTVQNVGNQPLDITNLAYPPDFPEALGVTRDCTPSTTVVAGAGCTLSIDFWPLATSATGANTPLSESVSLTNNNLNVDGTVQSVSLSGTERASYTPPVITSPTPYSAMSGANATFTWSPGIGVTQYRFTLGSAWGASDIYNGSQTTATSAAVTGIPTVGGVIFATLYYYQPLPNGALQH
ncbi:MAG TPA: choice-of-anchor D domain-containing protein, partial [Terracidiphilus sp.]|nr:choice-of-anchor D domain-containing protein [Terracidiphilus sp.]